MRSDYFSVPFDGTWSPSGHTGNAPELPGFEPAVPPRSALYNLPPNRDHRGESLTSYILRLAAAHLVDVIALVKLILKPMASHQRAANWLYRASGEGACARQAIAAVESQTGLRNLDRLTLLPVELLVRDCWDDESKWCPECIGEFSNEAPFIPLKWFLRGFDVCPRHKIRLETRCCCGDPNRWRLDLVDCVGCGQSLAHSTLGQGNRPIPQDEIDRAQALADFLAWVSSMEFAPHLNRFYRLSEVIELRSKTTRELFPGPVINGRGFTRFVKPTLMEACVVAVRLKVPMAQLFKIDEESRNRYWPTSVTASSKHVDWTPILDRATRAAKSGRPITIPELQREFHLSAMLLRVTLNRKGIPWTRIHLRMSPDERHALEHERVKTLQQNALEWVAAGNRLVVADFRRAMVAKLGPWAGRTQFRSEYARIFRDVFRTAARSVDSPAPRRGKQKNIDWPAIQAAAMTLGPDGRRPTRPELALRFQVALGTVTIGLRRRGVICESPLVGAALSVEERADLELQREVQLESLARLWLEDGNLAVFAQLAKALDDTHFKWVKRSAYRGRYVSIFSRVADGIGAKERGRARRTASH